MRVEPTTDWRLLRGASYPAPEMRELRAGPLVVQLDGVDVRYATVNGVEVVRRIYVAVRDGVWGTVAGGIEHLDVEQAADRFDVRFRVRHLDAELDFGWEGSISGSPAGVLTYAIDGEAPHAVTYNRIGICVHHPWRETAGSRFRARTPEGEIEGEFPDLIGPQALDEAGIHPLFPAFDRLEIEQPGGGHVRFAFAGDLWETEDHRNWTDANFKSYSTPISTPLPLRLAAGQRLRQQVTVEAVDVHGVVRSAAGVTLHIGEPTGGTVPPVGIEADRRVRRLDEAEVAVLAELHPAHLRVEVSLDDPGWSETFGIGVDNATRVGCALEVVIRLREREPQLDAVLRALASFGRIARILVISADSRTGGARETTPEALFDEVRRAASVQLPGVDVIGGTESFFTELNRRRRDFRSWEGVCFGITPQVHAFADVDLMESLDAQAENVRSARALAGAGKVVVSSVTLKPRVNFFSAEREPAPPPGELPESVDVRQASLLGAAWTAGSLANLVRAGVDSVTYYESTGWRGLLAREEPEMAASPPGEHGDVFPLYHPLADVCEWRGAALLGLTSSDESRAIGLAIQDDSLRILVANLTPDEFDIVLKLDSKVAEIRRLNEGTAVAATRTPARFREERQTSTIRGELNLTLTSYEVLRVDA